MLEKVDVIVNGETTSVDLISEFDVNVNEQARRFVLLTANEIDQNGLIKLLATEISEGKFIRIASDDDWTVVKNVMRSIISGSKGDFTYTNTSDSMSFEASADYARVIAVQDSAKQALVKDYEEKKPAAQEQEAPSTEEVKEDPNAAIYPTENETVPIGSEVVPGIADVSEAPVVEEAPVEETPAEEPQDLPVQGDEVVEQEVVQEAQSTEKAPVEEPKAEEIAVTEAPVAETPVVSTEDVNEAVDNAKQELIDAIVAAVDKYIEKKGNGNLKSQIAKMQEELQKMSDELNTQE